MSPMESFMDAVEAMGLHIEPTIDTSAEGEYVVIYGDRTAALFGDDGPAIEAVNWDVYYVAPIGYNRIGVRNAIRQAIFNAFNAWPRDEDVSDQNGQRYWYQFSTIGGGFTGTT